jgi:hypothetical protein
MSNAVNFCLGVFSYIVATSIIVSYAFFYEAQLGHDGTQAAVVWRLLQVAIGYDLGSYLR